MAQLLSKCGLFFAKREIGTFESAELLCGGGGQREVIGHFKDVHRSQGRCREHLKATPASTFCLNLHNLIVPICWRHCALKNVHFNDLFQSLTLVKKMNVQIYLHNFLTKVISDLFLL